MTMTLSGKAVVAFCLTRPNVWGTTAFINHGSRNVKFNQRQNYASEASSSSLNYFFYTESDAVDDDTSSDNGPSFHIPQEYRAAAHCMNTPTAPGPIVGDFPSSPAVVPEVVVGEKGAIKTSRTSDPAQESETLAYMQQLQDIWDTSVPVEILGDSRRTWSFQNSAIEHVQVLLKADGQSPLNADVELWQGPDGAAQKLAIFVEGGNTFSTVIATPRYNNAIAIRNKDSFDYPLSACVLPDIEHADGASGLSTISERLMGSTPSNTVSGGDTFSFPLDKVGGTVKVLLRTENRFPLNARIELLQEGPDKHNRQVMEIFTEDGTERPFFALIETPGPGNVLRIENTCPMQFPLVASVEHYRGENDDIVKQGDDNSSFLHSRNTDIIDVEIEK